MNSSSLLNIIGSTSLAFITGIFSTLSILSCKWLIPGSEYSICASGHSICPYNYLNSRPINRLVSLVVSILSGYGCYKQLTFEKRIQNLKYEDTKYKPLLGFFSGLLLGYVPFIGCRVQSILNIAGRKI